MSSASRAPAAAGEKGDALDLIGIEPGADVGEPPAAGADLRPDRLGAHGAGGVLGQTAGVAQGVVAEGQVGALADQLGEAQEVIRETALEAPGGVEEVVEQRFQGRIGLAPAMQPDQRRLLRLPVQMNIPAAGGRSRIFLKSLHLRMRCSTASICLQVPSWLTAKSGQVQ